MANCKSKAFIQSDSEWEEYLWQRIAAFAPPKVTDVAVKQGAYRNDEFKTGYNFHRNAFKKFGSKTQVCSIDYFGTHEQTDCRIANCALRTALRLVYNSQDAICRSEKQCRTQDLFFNKDGSAVWEDDLMQRKTVTSVADIVFSGKSGKPYIWLNKTECVFGLHATMMLVEMDCYKCCKPFSQTGSSNIFLDAVEIQKQCLQTIEEDFTPQELDMIVECGMSKEDNYNSVVPIFTKKQQQIIDGVQKQISESFNFVKPVEAVFNKFIKGKISSHQLSDELLKIAVQQKTCYNATAEKMFHLQQFVSFKTELTKLALLNQAKSKAKVQQQKAAQEANQAKEKTRLEAAFNKTVCQFKVLNIEDRDK